VGKRKIWISKGKDPYTHVRDYTDYDELKGAVDYEDIVSTFQFSLTPFNYPAHFLIITRGYRKEGSFFGKKGLLRALLNRKVLKSGMIPAILLHR
jgi:hypothetical protein